MRSQFPEHGSIRDIGLIHAELHPLNVEQVREHRLDERAGGLGGPALLGPVRSDPAANLGTITIVFTVQTRRLDELAGISPEQTIIPSFSCAKIVPPLAEAMRLSLAPSDVSAQGIQGSSGAG